MKILAIETSFDDTSVAILENEFVLSMRTKHQMEKHRSYGGVIPELASRLHSEYIFDLIEYVSQDANILYTELDAIAVTKGPGLIGTLQVGLVVAKTLSMLLQIPVYGINHMQAHIYSPFVDKALSSIPEKANVVLLSGGHTLIAVKDGFKIKIMGETRDDSIGEAFDKVANLFDLPYPGGPQIDRIFKTSTESPIQVPVTDLPGFDFSYSGTKSYIKVNKDKFERDRIIKGFQISAFEQILIKIKKLSKQNKNKNLILGGGVVSNHYFRQELKKLKLNISLPRLIYAIDNAGMVGYAAYYLIKNKQISPMSLDSDVNPRLRTENL